MLYQHQAPARKELNVGGKVKTIGIAYTNDVLTVDTGGYAAVVTAQQVQKVQLLMDCPLHLAKKRAFELAPFSKWADYEILVINFQACSL